MAGFTSNPIREFFPNLLLITGSGRERGKTMLACNIISKWKKNEDIVAIKISAHNHEDPDAVNLVYRSDGFTVWEEKELSPKDSGRFLEAGAGKVFYLEAVDQELLKAFRFVYALCNEKALIICESGGLGRLIQPGVMLFVQFPADIVDSEKESLRKLSNHIVYSPGPELSDPSLILRVTDHQWELVRDDQ
jgi:hypothetical protein